MVTAGILVENIKLPGGVTARLEGGILTVRAGNAEVRRHIASPRISVRVDAGIEVKVEKPKRKEFAEFNALVSEIRTMIQGVQTPFEYRLKIVYAHFPIKVQVKGNEFVIENFLGERYPRKAAIVGGARISVTGDQVVVTSPDIEEAGQTAANIEKATRIKNYDHRVFQDGIYITSKAGKVLS